MRTLDESQPLSEQVRTREDEQQGKGAADMLYDAEQDEYYILDTIEDTAETVHLREFWSEDDLELDMATVQRGAEQGRFAVIDRDASGGAYTNGREFAVAAFKELTADRDLTEEFEPLGLAFCDIKFQLLIAFGPDAFEDVDG